MALEFMAVHDSKKKKNPVERIAGKHKVRKDTLICPQCGQEFDDEDEYADHRQDEKRDAERFPDIDDDEEEKAMDDEEENVGEEGIAHEDAKIKPKVESKFKEDDESEMKRKPVSPEVKSLNRRLSKMESNLNKLVKTSFKKLGDEEEDFDVEEDEDEDEEILSRVDAIEDKLDKILEFMNGAAPEEVESAEFEEEAKANYKNQGKNTKVLDRKELLSQVVNPNDTLPAEGFANDATRQKLYKKGAIQKGRSMESVAFVNRDHSKDEIRKDGVEDVIAQILMGKKKSRDVFYEYGGVN